MSAVLVPSFGNDAEPLGQMSSTNMAEKIKEITSNKFKCMLCGKCFKNPSFALKHWRKTHSGDPDMEFTACETACAKEGMSKESLGTPYKTSQTVVEKNDSNEKEQHIKTGPLQIEAKVDKQDLEHHHNHVEDTRHSCQIFTSTLESPKIDESVVEADVASGKFDAAVDATVPQKFSGTVRNEVFEDSCHARNDVAKSHKELAVLNVTQEAEDRDVVNRVTNSEPREDAPPNDCSSLPPSEIDSHMDSMEQLQLAHGRTYSGMEGTLDAELGTEICESVGMQQHDSNEVVSFATVFANASSMQTSTPIVAAPPREMLLMGKQDDCSHCQPMVRECFTESRGIPTMPQASRDDDDSNLSAQDELLKRTVVTYAQHFEPAASANIIGLDRQNVKSCNLEMKRPGTEWIKEVALNKFKCLLCSKCFKHGGHAEKHLKKSHPDVLMVGAAVPKPVSDTIVQVVSESCRDCESQQETNMPSTSLESQGLIGVDGEADNVKTNTETNSGTSDCKLTGWRFSEKPAAEHDPSMGNLAPDNVMTLRHELPENGKDVAAIAEKLETSSFPLPELKHLAPFAALPSTPLQPILGSAALPSQIPDEIEKGEESESIEITASANDGIVLHLSSCLPTDEITTLVSPIEKVPQIAHGGTYADVKGTADVELGAETCEGFGVHHSAATVCANTLRTKSREGSSNFEVMVRPHLVDGHVLPTMADSPVSQLPRDEDDELAGAGGVDTHDLKKGTGVTEDTVCVDTIAPETQHVKSCSLEIEPPAMKNIKQVSPKKFKCMLCGRCFKDGSYAEKHLKKSHPDVLMVDTAGQNPADNSRKDRSPVGDIVNAPEDVLGRPAIQGSEKEEKTLTESLPTAARDQDIDKGAQLNDVQMLVTHSENESNSQIHDSVGSMPSIDAALPADPVDRMGEVSHPRKIHPELIHANSATLVEGVVPQVTKSMLEKQCASNQDIRKSESAHLVGENINEDATIQQLDRADKQTVEIMSHDLRRHTDERETLEDESHESESSQLSGRSSSLASARISNGSANDSDKNSVSPGAKRKKHHLSWSKATSMRHENSRLNERLQDGYEGFRRVGKRCTQSPPRTLNDREKAERAEKYRNTLCRSGRDCTRRDCWFSHPFGRHIDARGACPADCRRASPARRHRRQRSESLRRHQRQRSESTRHQRERSTPRRSRQQRSETLRRRRQRRKSAQRFRLRSATPHRVGSRTYRHRGRSESPRPKRVRSESSSHRSPSRHRRRCQTPSGSESRIPDDSHADLPSTGTSFLQQSPELAKADTFKHVITDPMTLSFRQFVKREIHSDLTPEEILGMYQEYTQKLMKQNFEHIKDTALVFDMYHPKALTEQHSVRICNIQSRARVFVNDMQNQRYADLCLVASDVSQIAGTRTGCRVSHLRSPHFAFDPNVNSLLLCHVPPTISLADILRILQQQPGFSAVSAPYFQDDRISRELRVRFETEEFARSTATNLAGVQLKDEFAFRFTSLQPSQTLEASLAPPAFSSMQTITEHVDLSARILRKLDGLCKVPPEISEALLNYSGSSEQKLDLQILYLRRVHHFCFYTCQWCVDEWDLCRRCGPAFLRSQPVIHDICDEFVGVHANSLESFISGASLQEPALPSSEGALFCNRLDSELVTKIREITPAKFECMLCNKFFKGSEYVQKHLRKNHPELREPIFEQACQDVVATAYLADLKRPGWPLCERSNTPVQETSAGALAGA